jgi:cell division protein ZapE
MILSRLFSALFAAGVVLVATSNAAPDELYADGLNRALFLPFIETLRRHAEIVQLDSPVDYRLRKLARLPVYICPLGPEADRQMDEQWAAMTAGIQETALDLQVKGRKLHVRRAAGRAARFDFSELCEAPLAARDFLALAARFDTVFLDGAPVMDDARRNAAKRFILLIDTLYDKRARLVISAAAAPDRLYAGTTGAEAFEFRRTASRLAEMQDRAWFGSSSDAGETEQLRKRH